MPSFLATQIGNAGLSLNAPSTAPTVGQNLSVISGSGLDWTLGFSDAGDVTGAAVEAALGYVPANNASVLHTTGAETKAGILTLSSLLIADGGVQVPQAGIRFYGSGSSSLLKASAYGDSLVLPTFTDTGNLSVSGNVYHRTSSGAFRLATLGKLEWRDSVDALAGTTDALLARKSATLLAVQANSGLSIRNLADSADAPILASNATFSGTLNVTSTATVGTSLISQASGSSAWQTTGAYASLIGTRTDFIYYNGTAQLANTITAGSGGPSHLKTVGNSCTDITSLGGNITWAIGQNSTVRLLHAYINTGTTRRLGLISEAVANVAVAIGAPDASYTNLLLTQHATTPGDFIRARDSALTTKFAVDPNGVVSIGDADTVLKRAAANELGVYAADQTTLGAVRFDMGRCYEVRLYTSSALAVSAGVLQGNGTGVMLHANQGTGDARFGVTNLANTAGVVSLEHAGFKKFVIGNAGRIKHGPVSMAVTDSAGMHLCGLDASYANLILDAITSQTADYLTARTFAAATEFSVGVGGIVTAAGSVQQGYASITPSYRQRMAATGAINLESGNGSGTWQTGYRQTYDAGGLLASFFGATPVAKQSGDIGAGLVALGLFSSTTGGGGGTSGPSLGLILVLQPPSMGM